MRRFAFPCLCLSLALTACAGLDRQPVKVTQVNAWTPGPSSKAAGGVNQPIFAPGQQWRFRRVNLWTQKEQERTVQEVLFESDGRQMLRWTITDSDDATRRGSVTGELLDPKTLSVADSRIEGQSDPLRFPLHPGKTWTVKYRFHGAGGRVVEIEQTAIVKGWETLTVPAGTFRTLKVERSGRYTARESLFTWQGQIDETHWYAPDARRIVRTDYRDTQGNGSLWDQWREELTGMKL